MNTGCPQEDETMTYRSCIFGLPIVLLVWTAPVGAADRFGIGLGEEISWTSGESYMADTTGGMLRPFRIEPDQNLTGLAFEQGATVSHGKGLDFGFVDDTEILTVFDQDSATAFIREVDPAIFGKGYGGGNILWLGMLQIDLAGRFPINRIRFYPHPDRPERFLPWFQIFVNDGQPEHLDAQGYPIWTTIRKETENAEVVVDTEIPPQLIRFFALQPVKQLRTWEVAEIELYGEGFMPKAWYRSEIVDFGTVTSWGTLRWIGDRDPAADVLIQTRTGMDDDPNVYWRYTGRGDEILNIDERGNPLTRKAYGNLKKQEQGPITYDTDSWSFWSAPYDFDVGAEGVQITSPGPRTHFQVSVDFRSTITDGAYLENLEWTFSNPPAAHEVLAEIWPLEVEPAVASRFIYALTPTIIEDDLGFDSVEIHTPIHIERVAEVRFNRTSIDLDVFPPQIEDRRFVVRFPRLDKGDTKSLLEIEFDARVLRYGTEFSARVFDSESEEVPQLVTPGNATDLLLGDELSVRTRLEGMLLANVSTIPNPFTPNGDGINDVLSFTYDLLTLTGPAPVEVTVHTLSGSLVRRIYEGEDVSGTYLRTWDGMDEHGKAVSPGVYLYRISVQADQGEECVPGVLSVVY